MVDIARFIPDFLPGGDDAPTQPGPASENLPGYQKALANQFSNAQLQARLDKFDPNVARAYRELQTERVNVKGSAPYSAPVIAQGISAAGKSTAYTPEPEGNIFQNLTSDVGAIASVVNPLKLIPGLVKEVLAIPNFAEEVIPQLAKATNPLEALGAIAQGPGARLVPGSYLAGTMAPGGPGLASGVQQHPLFSALDVLPYASKAARLTPMVKAAEAARESQILAATANADLGLIPATSRIAPIRTAIENYRPGTDLGFMTETRSVGLPSLGLTADYMVPNKLGQVTAAIGEKARQVPVLNNVFDSTLRPRGVGRLIARGQSEIVQDIKSIKRGLAEQTAFEVKRFWDDQVDAIRDISPEDKLLLTRKAELPNETILPPHLQPHFEDIAAQSERLRQAGLSEGLADVQMYRGPEAYPAATAKRLNDKQAETFAMRDAIRSSYDEWEHGAPAEPEIMMPDLIDIPTVRQSRMMAEKPEPVNVLEPHPGTLDVAQPHLDALDAALESRDWYGALGEAQQLKAKANIPSIDLAEFNRAIKRNIDLESTYIPARWQPSIVAKGKAGLIEALESGKAPTAWADSEGKVIIPEGMTKAQALTQAANNVYSWMDPAQFKVFSHFYQDGIHELMRTAPETPVYIPHFTPEQAFRELNSPSFFNQPVKVSAEKARSVFQSPGMQNDPFLALSASAQQMVERGVQRRVGQYVINNYGRTLRDLQNSYFDKFGEILDTKTQGGLVSPEAALKAEIAKEWRVFDPDAYVKPSLDNQDFNSLSPDTYLVPKDVSDAMREFANPKQTAVGQALNPIMKAFRASVLTLSPRFYMNNVTGGGIMTGAASANPFTITKFARDAWNLVRNPEVEQTLRDGTKLRRVDITNMPPQQAALQGASEWALNLKDTKSILGAYQQFEAFKSIRSIWDRMEGGAVKFNTLNDQFWQTMNFLEGRENALNKGLSESRAMQAGVESSRRFFETWDTLTPSERVIIKSLIPFYGFQRNLLKFVAQYPTTHPTRLGLLSSLAKAEEEDYGSGLPQQFAEMFWLGPVDSKGKVTAINVGGMNPFQDVNNYPALLGFLMGKGGNFSALTSSVNPLIGSTLKSLGIDTSGGTGDLYPQTTIDPTTGKVTVVPDQGLLTNLATSIVPQANIPINLAGMNGQFKAMLATNPSAAGRTLMAAAGIPTPLREIDVSKERMKAEISRYTSAEATKNEALKSGNWSAAQAWPTLREYLDKVQERYQTDPESMKAYLLNDDGSALRAVKAGVTGSR